MTEDLELKIVDKKAKSKKIEKVEKYCETAKNVAKRL